MKIRASKPLPLDRNHNVYYSRHMDINNAIIMLSALSQETRLQVVKLLMEYGNEGAPAGVISTQMGVPHNTLSFHLTHLSHAGLVSSRKTGRSIIYSANIAAMEDLVGYLKDNCCARDRSSADCTLAPMPQKKVKKKLSCC